MQRSIAVLIGWLICAGAFAAPPPAHTKASLLLSAATAKPGDTILAGVRLQMDPGWHTYWKNPSTDGTGIPTKIAWQLPAGVTAGELQWPVPEKIGSGTNISYAYEKETVLLVPLKLSADLKPFPIELKAKVTWLECLATECVPGKADVAATLEIGDALKASTDAATLEAWKRKLPNSADGLNASAVWENPANGDTRPLLLNWTGPNKVTGVDFFPYAGENFEFQPAAENLTKSPGAIQLRKLVTKSEGDWPKEISGVLVVETGSNALGFEVKLPIGGAGAGAAAKPTTPSANAVEKSSPPLWRMLVYAFIGGLILNIMPCVLPVIALKILGFVGQAKESPGRVRQLGLLYAVGVLVSFSVLAALVIGVNAAGHKAGWGIQFSNPHFIVGITALVTLVALNLFGVFEVTLSSRVLGAAGGLASQHGAAGAFFNGVLATVLATPCTAPFLGVALGFAFTQPPSIIVLMFLTVGLGLAAPYVVLSWNPAWLKFLPKPGGWMEKFKMAMGFPMLATAVWLASLASSFYGDRTWWLGVFLVFLGAAAWVFGEFFQRGSKRRGLAAGFVLALLITGYAWPLDAGLRWREPIKEIPSGETVQHAPEGYPWKRWSADAVTKARAAGHPVIVDFTAKWCQTCNISVKPALETKAVIEKLKQLDAVALVADYTRFPDDITEELAKFDRRGVPLVLVYSRDATQPPQVLPEPLPYPVPYSPVVLDALEKIAK
ncbi:MAG: hypothetical protein EXS35_17120 [Pedosphaera sp.]|nr:hypothetical protein [Pedosphaera sp.]